jgi:hypothetical protein
MWRVGEAGRNACAKRQDRDAEDRVRMAGDRTPASGRQRGLRCPSNLEDQRDFKPLASSH